MTEESLKYFQQYRDMIKHQISIIEQIKWTRELLEQLRGQSTSLSNEIEGMKRIITYMIDNDLDPVEAKLKMDEKDKNSYWNEISKQEADELIRNKQYIQNIAGLGLGAIGATGATGAVNTIYNGQMPVKAYNGKI